MASDAVFDGLPTETQAILRSYVKDTSGIFGPLLDGMILYGSAVRGEFLPGRSNLNVLLLLTSHEREALKRYARGHKKWAREQIVVPLFLTESELHASVASFPLEYVEIQEQHRLLAGRDPFIGLHVDTTNLGLEIRQNVRSNLVRLRQRFVEGGGTEEAITILLPLSLTAILPSLRGLHRLEQRTTNAHAETLIQYLQDRAGIDCSGFRDVLNLKRGLITPGPAELPRLFDRYTASLEALMQFLENPTTGR